MDGVLHPYYLLLSINVRATTNSCLVRSLSLYFHRFSVFRLVCACVVFFWLVVGVAGYGYGGGEGKMVMRDARAVLYTQPPASSFLLLFPTTISWDMMTRMHHKYKAAVGLRDRSMRRAPSLTCKTPLSL